MRMAPVAKAHLQFAGIRRQRLHPKTVPRAGIDPPAILRQHLQFDRASIDYGTCGAASALEVGPQRELAGVASSLRVSARSGGGYTGQQGEGNENYAQ